MEQFVPKLILVPTDFSAPASHALRYASALGERFGAHLLVIYADSFAPPVDFTASGIGTFAGSRETMIEEAREELESHAERNIGTNVPYDLRVIVDNPLDAITSSVRESGASFVVMGTHGRSGIQRLLFGSVTEAVMRTASVPVIAVNSSTSENASVSRVLCPVDFTVACRAALRQAVALADNDRAPIVLFRGVEGKELHPSIQELIRLHEWAPPEIAGRSELKTVLTSAPAAEILELALATATDLIAIEVRADRSLADDLRGTLAERIVQQSHCPVLTVNPFAARSFPNIDHVRQLVAVD